MPKSARDAYFCVKVNFIQFALDKSANLCYNYYSELCLREMVF